MPRVCCGRVPRLERMVGAADWDRWGHAPLPGAAPMAALLRSAGRRSRHPPLKVRPPRQVAETADGQSEPASQRDLAIPVAARAMARALVPKARRGCAGLLPVREVLALDRLFRVALTSRREDRLRSARDDRRHGRVCCARLQVSLRAAVGFRPAETHVGESRLMRSTKPGSAAAGAATVPFDAPRRRSCSRWRRMSDRPFLDTREVAALSVGGFSRSSR